MASDEHQDGRSFKVQDRRRFSESGEARDEVTDEPVTPPTSETLSPTATAAPSVSEAPEAAQQEPPPQIDFSTFVIGLSAQALALLGEIPDPLERSVQVDLEAARQVIDILGMLREKTSGNLDSAENSLLENILYDLRMKYVDRVRDR